ncbi:JNK-interacting protein 1 [Chamberlinius hualienensis]
MADPQFEEFRVIFDKLPQHIKAPTYCYRLTHDILLDEDLSNDESNIEENGVCDNVIDELCNCETEISFLDKSDIVNNSPKRRLHNKAGNFVNGDNVNPLAIQHCGLVDPNQQEQCQVSTPSRKRRRLPETPTIHSTPNGKGSSSIVFKTKAMSLADEIREAEKHTEAVANLSINDNPGELRSKKSSKKRLSLFPFRKCPRLAEENDSSPEDKIFNTDADSGNSTTHSPDGNGAYKSILNGFSSPASSTCSSGVSLETLESLEATHRGLHKFMPRHRDEVEIEIGDLLYVQREADDLWCEGVNLRTGKCGIFPSAYATDVEYTEFDPISDGVKLKKESFFLKYLSSIEVSISKGNQVLCQAIKKITSTEVNVHQIILEIDDNGLRMVDRSKPLPNQVPCHDYFFCLKNVSFCGFHPEDCRYFGFITKHPTERRFACHVFLGEESTRCVAEAVGRAFQRFEQKFAEAFERLEDIYLE